MYKRRDWLFSYQSVILLVIFCPKAFFITRVEVSLDLSLGVIRPVEVPVWFVTSVLVFHWFVASFSLVILKHCPHKIHKIPFPAELALFFTVQ